MLMLSAARIESELCNFSLETENKIQKVLKRKVMFLNVAQFLTNEITNHFDYPIALIDLSLSTVVLY